MSLNTASAISLGVLGGIAAWLFLGPLGGALAIWAAFVAWACFYHCGGAEHGLQATIAGNVLGAIVGGITMLAATRAGVDAHVGVAVWAGICVGIGVAVMVLLSNIPLFGSIPAQIYGFACVVALTLVGNAAGALTAPSLANPIVAIILSMIAGAVLGYISERFAIMLHGAAARGHAKA